MHWHVSVSKRKIVLGVLTWELRAHKQGAAPAQAARAGVGGGGAQHPRSGLPGPPETPPGPEFLEARVYTCEPRFGGTQPSVLWVLKSGQETSVSGF